MKISKNVVLAHCTFVLFSIIFTINVEIGTYFVYYKYMNCNKEIGATEGFNYQAALSY